MNRQSCNGINFWWFAAALVTITLGPCQCLLAQGTGSLTGKVVDSRKGTPVPYASIFMVNTTLGVMAGDDGKFVMPSIPVGKYDIHVSSVGYKSGVVTLAIKEADNAVMVLLEENISVLKEVTVQGKRPHYFTQLKVFKTYFLGQTENAAKCHIVNPEVINFEYQGDGNVLIAWASKPIIVENRALGYRIFYSLTEFRLDFANQVIKMAGYPRFEALQADSETQLRHWIKHRDVAYYGSLLHFMRSLKSQSLMQNDFVLYGEQHAPEQIQFERKIGLAKKGTTQQVTKGDPPGNLLNYYRVQERFLFTAPPDSVIQLKIVYKGEVEERNYPTRKGTLVQTSFLRFKRKSLVIHENGYYENPLEFYLEGYLAWSEKIAELMPYDYIPTPKRTK